MSADRGKQESILDRDLRESLEEVRASGMLGYRSEELPIWCPGCGYFGITHAVNHALNRLDVPTRNLVVVSGIGCAGRYPFFARCYGFHVVHGRTLPVAAGVKMANPALTVLAIGGDGDGLAIGGGHLPHAIRRNVDMTFIMFDNGIYGLTKGQSSPTTPSGQVTGTHPYGNPETPLNPMLMAVSYGASFAGQGYAGEPKSLTEIMVRALSHKGFSFLRVVSPCVTFDHSNILYDRLRNLWKPVPEEHDHTERSAAIDLAMSGDFFHGVFVEENAPTWEERQLEIRRKAGNARFSED